MDWLSANHILIDCGREKLIFPGLEGMQVISAHQFEREIQEGAKCFMLLVCSIVIYKVQKDMFVVQEFMDVFPDEIPRLPPKREIKIAIDLIPGAGPVSISPYRMAPAEETTRRLIGEAIHSTQCFSMGSSSAISEEERWFVTPKHRL